MPATIFLDIFFVGFGLTLIAFILGTVDAGFHGHADIGAGHGHADFGAGHGHAHIGAGHGHGPGDPGGAGHDLTGHSDVSTISPVNFQTLMAFLMGFGGIGYVTATTGSALLLAIPAGVAGGFAAGWLVLKWLRFLVRGERPLPPTSYIGVTGRLTAGIREGGIGELVYTHQGTRTVLPVRSADGKAIPRGTQVVVLRYERGIGYVEPLAEVVAPDPSAESSVPD
jgi:hypothetical protein